MVLWGGLAASVMLAPEYAAGQAAIRKARALPDPPMLTKRAVFAFEHPWFAVPFDSGDEEFREILRKPQRRLWLSRSDRCNILCRARRYVVIKWMTTRYTIDEMLRAYIATVDMHGHSGMQEAAAARLGRDLRSLDLAETAALTALIRSPEWSTRRRNIVLRRMRDERYISQSEYDEADVAPLP